MKKGYKKGDEEMKMHARLMEVDWENPADEVSKYDSREYKMGLLVEGEEHANIAHGDLGIVSKIVCAHLKEDSKYYTHLKEMEDKFKKEGKKEKKGEDEED